MKNKKTILVHSNFSRAFTGFGKHKKNILLYLHKTGKYNLVEAANGQAWKSPDTEKMPWPCYGTLPNNFMVLQGNDKRAASYGHNTIDKIIQEVKPDVYMGIEDIWGFSDFPSRPWWKKINSMVWTTLDSLPLLQQAIDFAPQTKNYYVWSSFAEKAFREMGYDHIKTLRGCLDVEKFYAFSPEEKVALRQNHSVNKDDFIIGFVFRNQLRKSVPSLIHAFSIFKQTHPNAKLLLHTHWPEAWDIPRLMEEFNVDGNDVLTTYYCRACHNYHIEPFRGEQRDCPLCKSKKSFNTTNIAHGISEKQLNEVYNFMDVYCHPFTSGGQELPIQEAKLTELITLVTNYSCGEDSASLESGGVPLDWEEYREPGTQFIKASTKVGSIVEELEKVYAMKLDDRQVIGKKARQWVVDNFSIEVIGKKLEDIIDNMPDVDYDFSGELLKCNPDAAFEFKASESRADLLIRAHKEILNSVVDKNSLTIKQTLLKIRMENPTPEIIVASVREEAKKKNAARSNIDLNQVLDGDDPNKRVAVLVPQAETDVFLVNSLLMSLQKQYKDCQIYIFTQPELFPFIEDNPACHKCLAYGESLENPQLLEGQGGHTGFFKAAFFPCVTTQKFVCYLHNGTHTNQFKLKK